MSESQWPASDEEPVRQHGEPPVEMLTEQPEAAAMPQRSHKRRNLIIGGAIVIAAAIGVGVGVGIGGSGKSAPPAAPAPITVSGSITIPFASSDLFAPNAVDPLATGTAGPGLNDPCTTTGGFTDISQGAAVTIGDSAGKTLAVVALDAGSVQGNPGSPASCVFNFEAQVPSVAEYTVTISHRGTQVFTLAQAQSGMNLALGD